MLCWIKTELNRHNNLLSGVSFNKEHIVPLLNGRQLRRMSFYSLVCHLLTINCPQNCCRSTPNWIGPLGLGQIQQLRHGRSVSVCARACVYQACIDVARCILLCLAFVSRRRSATPPVCYWISRAGGGNKSI